MVYRPEIDSDSNELHCGSSQFHPLVNLQDGFLVQPTDMKELDWLRFDMSSFFVQNVLRLSLCGNV